MASLFTKILQGIIPGEILYKDQDFFVIKDIKPEDVTHLLIIPIEEIVSINDIDTDSESYQILLGKMILLASKLAKQQGFDGGYKMRLNAGEYQEIPHIHMHVISNR